MVSLIGIVNLSCLSGLRRRQQPLAQSIELVAPAGVIRPGQPTELNYRTSIFAFAIRFCRVYPRPDPAAFDQ